MSESDDGPTTRPTEVLLRRALDRSPVAQVITDHRGRLVHANPAFCELIGLSLEQVLGSEPSDTLLPDDVSLLQDQVIAALAARSGPEEEVSFSIELRLRHADGTVRRCETTVSSVIDVDGTTSYICHLVDVTAVLETQEMNSRLVRIAETTSDMVGIVDGSGRLVYLNQAGRRFRGSGDGMPADRNVLHAYAPVSARRVVHEIFPQLREGVTWEGELNMIRGDGAVKKVWQTLTPEMDAAGHLQRISAVARDVTEQRRLEAELSYQATHDPLTQLPNRALLLHHLDLALDSRRSHARSTALLFIDLDRFKVVNDRLGHEAGDELLRIAAERIAQAVRPGDVVARLGGDEFVVLCAEIADDEQASTIAHRIRHRLENESVTIGAASITATASIGVAVEAGGDGPRAEGLLREADAAMYVAKERGRNRVELFDDGMRSRASHRRALAEELRGALNDTELHVVHQPIVDLTSDLVTGSEVLLRWLHPERGLLSPTDFVGIAEDTGLASDLGAHVLELACVQLSQWTDELGERAPVLHANLSPRQLASPTLASVVQRAIDGSGADPTRLCLEVTERALIQDLKAAFTALGALRDLGVRIAVDDFGTGHTSLYELRQLPVDALKIDRSLVDALGPARLESTLVDAAVRLAHSLDLRVVAEGVETTAQLAVLQDLGCDLAQGYLFARPGAAEEVSALVRGGPLALTAGVRERGVQARAGATSPAAAPLDPR